MQSYLSVRVMPLHRNAEKISLSFDVHAKSREVYLFLSSRYIYREFVFSEEELAKQRAELEAVEITEKDLWVRPMFHPSRLC